MNDKLKVFNSDVIPVYIDEHGRKTVIGWELHEGLKIKTAYKDWFPRMCEYGFYDGKDFCSFLSESTGGRPAENHQLTLDMEKHIAMIQRTPEGKAIRDKLISLETNISELSPELRLLISMEIKQKEQERTLAAHDQELKTVNQKIDGIRDVVSLSPNSWRPDAKKLIARIVQTMGGNEYIKDVNAEIYQMVDERAGVSLKTRLTNKRRRMADEESSGKTALALHLARNLPGPVLYADADCGLSPYILGEQKDIYLLSVPTLEDTLKACQTAAIGGFSTIVIDTVTALATRTDIQIGINGKCIAPNTQAKVLSQCLPILNNLMRATGCTLVLVSQLRNKPGILIGDPSRSTGGRATGYYAALRLRTNRIELLKDGGDTIGQKIRIKVEKSKYAPPGKAAEPNDI